MAIPTSRTKENAQITLFTDLCIGCGSCVEVCKDFNFKIENNKVALTFEMAIKLTEILDCTLYDIAGIEDDLEIQGFQKVESEDIEFILFMKEKHKK